MTEFCSICGRKLIQGPSIDLHHLIPKTFGGTETILIHKVCHQKIHSLFNEKVLRDVYNNVPSIINQEDMKSFIKWVRKKPDDFMGKNKPSNKKRRNFR